MNRAILGAYKKGIKARADGLPESACPYDDKRNWQNKITWSRTFVKAWVNGWRGKPL